LPEGSSTASPVRSHSKENLNSQQQINLNIEEESKKELNNNPLILIKMERLNLKNKQEQRAMEENEQNKILLNGSLNLKEED
jgi:hypothetical protein